ERLVLLGQKPILVSTSDASSPEALGRVLADKFPGERPSLRGVLHMASTETPGDAPSAAALDCAVVACCESLLYAVQEVGKIRWTETPKLFVVTQGAQSSGAAVDPAQTMAWGLGRVAAVESPEFGVTLVDLDIQLAGDPAVDAAVTGLLAEVGARTDE